MFSKNVKIIRSLQKMTLARKHEIEREIMSAWSQDNLPELEEPTKFIEDADTIRKIQGLTFEALASRDQLINHVPILTILNSESAIYYLGAYILHFVRGCEHCEKNELGYFDFYEFLAFISMDRSQQTILGLPLEKKRAIVHSLEFLLECYSSLEFRHWKALADFSLLVKRSTKI